MSPNKDSIKNFAKHMLIRIYGYNITKDREEIIHDLSSFLNLAPELVRNLLPLGSLKASEFFSKNVKDLSIASLYSFYSRSVEYLFDLAYGNYWDIGTYAGSILIAKNSKGKILDYGAGIGSQLIIAWREGHHDLSYYDIKGVLFDFAEYRFMKRNMNVKMIPANEYQDNLPEKYDTIICKAVLEHVKDPILHLKRINKHLKLGGRLFLFYYPNKDHLHQMHFVHSIDINKWLLNKGFRRHYVKLFNLIPIRKIMYYEKISRQN
jgi:2-polyprenyl-3-methyl-5-hydroxy-6-metoxy-1,4-benzoquinol methylase